MDLAPIALFVYNRPWHTEQTLVALENNELASESTLFIFCDGPKEDSSIENLNNIKKVRNIIKSKKWCKKIFITERNKNIGLASNIVDGINKVINKHGKIIVLEDDLVTSPYFLSYCNEGLKIYKDFQNVYSINGFQFPLKIDYLDSFLSPLATSSWGWATWKDRWSQYKENIEYKKIIQEHPLIRSRFNFANYDYATMLDNPNSWAIKWYYSVFLMNGLGLFPTKTLVSNIGFDGSGEHCTTESIVNETAKDKIIITKKEFIDIDFYALLLNYFSKKGKTINNNYLARTINSIIKKLMR